MIRILKILLLFLIVPVMAIAQSGKIRGMITDQETGEPLIGATVLVVGTSIGAITDVNGEYTILNISAGLYEIRASYVGYQTKTIQNVRVGADSTSELNIQFTAGDVYLNQIEIVIDPIEYKLDELLKKMEFGTIAFNAPININIDDYPQIQLILSLAETVDELKRSITEEGEKVGAIIKVSNIMEAHLSGQMFEIEAITPEKQAVSKRQRTEWKWEIHPKQVGEHKLYLTLTAILEIDGTNTNRTIKTYDKIIVVKVTAIQEIGLFLKGNWQWLWTAILIPIVGWLWRRRNKKKK